MKQIPASLLTLLAGIVITLISLWVGQHHGLLPEQASAQAPLVDHFFDVMVTIATALFLVVQGAIVWFSIQFRQRPGDDTDGSAIEGNLPLEIVWTAIPAIIVIGLGIYSVDVYDQMGGFGPAHAHGLMAHQATPAASSMASSMGSATAAPLVADAEPGTETTTASPQVSPIAKYGFGAPTAQAGKAADVVVNVTGLQYAWLFNYPDRENPDSAITTGELHVPLGKAVQLNIAAQDVIHSFWVPQFRLKQDALPGQPTELRFVATKIGTYPVVCAELCGSYHGSMRTQLVVETPEEYEAWLTENRVAQAAGLGTAIAANSAVQLDVLSDLQSDAAFLADYESEIGVTAETLAQLQPHSPSL
jgi:cytochrome c oxidase subunit II